MTRRLVLTRRAKAQINSLYEYIAWEGSLEIADRYVGALLDRLAGLTGYPHRGTPRDDLRPGLRTVPFRRRLTIACAVRQEQVRIIAIAQTGQDMTRLLGAKPEHLCGFAALRDNNSDAGARRSCG